MRVLNLVTNADSVFFNEQVDVLERQGVETTTVSVPGDNRSSSVEAGESGRRSVLDYLRFYPSVLRESFEGHDLIHANYGLTAPAALGQPNLPVVCSLWGSDLMGRFGPLSKWCAERCDDVIVMNDEMAARLDRECHVIPHGVDLETFRPMDRSRARAAVGWDQGGTYVLFPYPGKRDVKNYPRARRVVTRADERLAADVKLRTLSGVAHDRVPLFMNAADAVVLTSKREGSPNTIKEAMACNVPVVATDVGDVRERLEGVAHSTVGRSDDELIEGLVAALRADGRANGRDAIRPLSAERMGERIRSVYEGVLGKSPDDGREKHRHTVSQ